MDSKIINLQNVRDGKELDKNFAAFIGHTNKFFGVTSDNLAPAVELKKIYYTIKFVEGSIRWLSLADKLGLGGLDQKGKRLLVEWIESLLKEIKNL